MTFAFGGGWYSRWLCLVALATVACGSDGSKAITPLHDGGAGQTDGAQADAAQVDAPPTDTAPADTAPADTAPADAMCFARSELDGAAAAGPSRVLYTNDFETPNVPLAVNCGNSLDTRAINVLYGSPAFQFNQVNTVEGVVIADPAKVYKNPSGQGGKYALGMLSSFQDDKLSLTFAVTGKPFLNVGFDLSSIDVAGCGGPFGVAAPVMKVSLYETVGPTHNFATPGKLLAEGMVPGTASTDAWTFAWSYGVVSLNATQATTERVSVVFDLMQSGYASFDNLSIVASTVAGVVDRNNDGAPDDVTLCSVPDAM